MISESSTAEGCVSPSTWFNGQTFNRIPDWLEAVPENIIAGNTKRVVGYLARRAGKGESTHPSQKEIGQALGLSEDQVYRAVAQAVKSGLLVIDRSNRNLRNEYFFPEKAKILSSRAWRGSDTANPRLPSAPGAAPIGRESVEENQGKRTTKDEVRRDTRFDPEAVEEIKDIEEERPRTNTRATASDEQDSRGAGISRRLKDARDFGEYFEQKTGEVQEDWERASFRGTLKYMLSNPHDVKGDEYDRVFPDQMKRMMDAFEPKYRTRGVNKDKRLWQLFLRDRTKGAHLYNKVGVEVQYMRGEENSPLAGPGFPEWSEETEEEFWAHGG